MMLFKLSLGNIRRSLKDYAIYFFTLVIGVSVFYVFNAIGEQAAMMEVTVNRGDVVELLMTMMSGVSIFVAGVLGLLIVYASRFLMKRRNREFALYMTLGMGKGKVSAILLLETVFVGLFSLVIGLVLGIGLSQLMSALVASLFEADMTAYSFVVSNEAILKTVLYFVAMYLVVIAFNSLSISRMKLIDLLQSGKKAERIKLKNPVICIIIFLFAAALLAYAYYQVGWQFNDLNNKMLSIYIGMGAAATFLIFWSLSGMLLRIVMSIKRVYFRGLNGFTFRQISSKVSTMVLSMTIICLMLFVTVCTLSAAFSVRNSMNANMNKLCPVDFEIEYSEYTDKEKTETVSGDVTKLYADYGYDLTGNLSEYVHFHSYVDPEFTFGNLLGNQLEAVSSEYGFLIYDSPFDVYRASDYNALMKLYGKEPLDIGEDEFALICNYKSMKQVFDQLLEEEYTATVMGHELKSKYAESQDGFVDISSQPVNDGLVVVPDSVAKEAYAGKDYVIGNYKDGAQENPVETERNIRQVNEAIHDRYEAAVENGNNHNYSSWTINTKTDIADATIGLGAIASFLGLYIGIVFLIACGAILALKELSESVDSVNRYDMLRKIGAEESDINRSLFRKTGLFFLLPLLLAYIHSAFGLKFAMNFLQIFGTEKMWSSIILTSVILLLIYGGYFLITFYSSKRIIRGRS